MSKGKIFNPEFVLSTIQNWNNNHVFQEPKQQDEDDKICTIDDSDDLMKYHGWAKTNPVLLQQDREREKFVLEDPTITGSSLESIRDRFYKMTSLTFQTSCNVGKKIGGVWVSSCGFFDCQKYVCLDKIYKGNFISYNGKSPGIVVNVVDSRSEP